MNVLELLTEPFQYAFMLRALIAVIIVALLNAVVGTFVVLRGMSLYGGALAHAILPGVAAGYLLGWTERNGLFWWGLLAGAVSALLIGWIRHDVRLREDAAIGITFSGMLALGVVMISLSGSYAVDLTHFLFGNILALNEASLWRMGIGAVILLVLVLVFYRRLLLVSFDPIQAKVLGLPVKSIDLVLLLIIAATIVVSLQTVGIALMTAMLVTPAATGFLLANRVPAMMGIGAGVAMVSGAAGLYLSYIVNISSGAAIVLVLTLAFVFVWVLTSIFKHKRA